MNNNNTNQPLGTETKKLDGLELLDLKYSNLNNSKIFKNYKSKIIDNSSELNDSLDNKSKSNENNSDLYDTLNLDNKPLNYGNKWSEEDKKQLIELLKENKDKEIDYNHIATKLGRSEGGIKGEIKKMILTSYLQGEEPDNIANNYNIQYKFVKILIKTYIDKEIENDIQNLEKENKFLRLKIENIELRKTIFKLSKKN